MQESKKQNLAQEVLTKLKKIVLAPFQNIYTYSITDLAIDNTRHILYAHGVNLKKASDFIIQVYDLGPIGKDFKKVATIKSYDLKWR